MASEVVYRPLDEETVSDLACCPGGLELAGKGFCGDLSQVAEWHRRMLRLGMRGVVAERAGQSTGFAEYMPSESAPFPIEAPGAAVLLCFHWAGTQPDDPEHLTEERRMVEAVIEEARPGFAGLATLGWNHPTHYPIQLLEDLGFQEIVREEPIALMWLPFRGSIPEPRLAPPRFRPRDLSRRRILAVDVAFSARCPYSVHAVERLKTLVAAHPDHARISLREHRIDTRQDAFRLAVSPWDWTWTYLNGEAVSLLVVSREEVVRELTRRVPR